MQAIALEWWLRPVTMHERLGEHNAVVCMLLYRRPLAAIASKFGVAIGLPKQPRLPNPVSSRTTNTTFGASARALTGAGQAALDSSAVRADDTRERTSFWILDNRHYCFLPVPVVFRADPDDLVGLWRGTC